MSRNWKKLKLDEEERSLIEQSLRKHWQDNSICMVELIRAEYNDREEFICFQDDEGNQISEKIQSQKKEYFVIIDYNLDLDWIVNDSRKNELFEHVSSEASIINSIPHSKLSDKQQVEFMHLLGNSLVAAINEQKDDAEKLLFEARNFVFQRLSEYSTCWTLLNATILLLIVLIAYLGLGNWLWNFKYPNWWLGVVWGISGAYLSIAYKAGKEQRDAEAGVLLHIINVMVKFFCAALFGVIGVLMLKNGHILPNVINEIGMDNNGAQLIGFICGFSEKFIPNLVVNLSKEK